MECLALEWASCARSAYFATTVPGMQVQVSPRVVYLINTVVPSVDGNHAVLLRCEASDCDALIDEIIAVYQSRGLTPYVAISPACSPADWPERLQARGFVPMGSPEQWLGLTRSLLAERLTMPRGVVVERVTPASLEDFCRVLGQTFGMPDEMLPLLAHGFGSINHLEGVENWIARVNGQVVGCASLFSYLGYSALGSGAVLPGVRFAGVAQALLATAYQSYLRVGSQMFLMQTSLGKLERLLQLAGASRLFSRQYYEFNPSRV